MEPLAIVISFDVGKQVVPGSIPGWITSQVHEFGFDRANAAFHWSVIPAISFPAHGLDHPSCIEDLAVIGGGILAAAIGVVNQAWPRLLALDGHDQGRDGQFRPHVVMHRPAHDLPGEEIEHDGQIDVAVALDLQEPVAVGIGFGGTRPSGRPYGSWLSCCISRSSACKPTARP